MTLQQAADAVEVIAHRGRRRRHEPLQRTSARPDTLSRSTEPRWSRTAAPRSPREPMTDTPPLPVLRHCSRAIRSSRAATGGDGASSRCRSPGACAVRRRRSPATTARRPSVVVSDRRRGRTPRGRSARVPRPRRSSCSRRGRPCRSSGSRPPSRRWAGACGSFGGCADGGAPDPPAVVVAPVRALVQRLGPHVEEIETGRVRPAASPRPRRPRRTPRRRSATGASTRSSPRRGRGARRRSSTSTPSPRTTRCAIDLWGDEVDRLYHVLRRRPTFDHRPRRRSRSSPSRAARHRRGASPRRGDCRRPSRWGAEQWERLAAGPDLRRHGVVAAVAHPRRATAARPARRRARSLPRRAAPDARPGAGAPRRGGGAGERRSQRPGARRSTPIPRRGCRCRSIGSSRTRRRKPYRCSPRPRRSRHAVVGRHRVRSRRRRHRRRSAAACTWLRTAGYRVVSSPRRAAVPPTGSNSSSSVRASPSTVSA